MKELLLITLLASLAGCQTQKQKSHQAFQAQIQEIEQARADQPLRPNGDPFPLLEEARSAGLITTEILADGILSGTFIESNDAMGDREVRIDLQLNLPTGPRLMTATAVFALPDTPPEWLP